MAVDLNSRTKVNMVIEEYSRLCLEFENNNYPGVEERINHVLTGVNLLRRDYVQKNGARNVIEYRQEYERFMNNILQNGELAEFQMIVRYSQRIQENLNTIKAQLSQQPHNVPEVDKLSIGIIILLGDINNRWYR